MSSGFLFGARVYFASLREERLCWTPLGSGTTSSAKSTHALTTMSWDAVSILVLFGRFMPCVHCFLADLSRCFWAPGLHNRIYFTHVSHAPLKASFTVSRAFVLLLHLSSGSFCAQHVLLVYSTNDRVICAAAVLKLNALHSVCITPNQTATNDNSSFFQSFFSFPCAFATTGELNRRGGKRPTRNMRRKHGFTFGGEDHRRCWMVYGGWLYVRCFM